MKARTILAIVLSIALILFASTCFATDNTEQDAMSVVQNVMENAGDGVKNVVNGTGNVVGGAVTGIGRGIGNMGNSINEGMQNMENTTENTTENTENMGGMINDTNGDYTAQRTATTRDGTGATTGTFFGMNATAWTWVIMGIVGASIIALVWFYGKQREDGYNTKHDDNF